MEFFSSIWNDILVGGLQSGLLRLYELTVSAGVPSFGIAIIIFTIIVRLILFPLSVTSLRSSRRMQLLSPRLKELQKQHKGDRQAMAQAQMELYKVHGVNPLMGCLPQLAQLPVLFALYWAIIGVTRDSANLEMAFLWISDLAQPDVWLPPGIELPFGLPGAFALTAGATQWVVQRMMMNRMTSDPQQQMIQNVMQFMPIMIVFFAMPVPRGTCPILGGIEYLQRRSAVDNHAGQEPQGTGSGNRAGGRTGGQRERRTQDESGCAKCACEYQKQETGAVSGVQAASNRAGAKPAERTLGWVIIRWGKPQRHPRLNRDDVTGTRPR